MGENSEHNGNADSLETTKKHFPKTRIKNRAVMIVLILILMFLLVAPVGQYASDIRTAFKSNGISWKTITEIGWSTRWFIGRLRSAPSDEKMIAHLNTHRAEFDSLAKAYYENVVRNDAYQKEAPYSPERRKNNPFENNAAIEKQLRFLGLWKLKPNMGPIIVNFENRVSAFSALGVQFKLVDHGPHSWWIFGQKLEKTYLYMPDIPPHPRWSNDPVRWLSYKYVNHVKPSTDWPTKIEDEHCAVRQIDLNWFIQNCDVEAYNR